MEDVFASRATAAGSSQRSAAREMSGPLLAIFSKALARSQLLQNPENLLGAQIRVVTTFGEEIVGSLESSHL